jgi:general secretion pathway protein G
MRWLKIGCLTVIAVGVTGAIVLPDLLGRQRSPYISPGRVGIVVLEQALKHYALHHDGDYPSTAQGLRVLVEQPANDPRWKGPYLESARGLTDIWGCPIQYDFPGPDGKPALRSYGPDTLPHTEDDLVNFYEP